MPVSAPDVIEISYMEGLQKAEKDLQRFILRARKYYQGDQVVFLTARMREYLNMGAKEFSQIDDFRLNVVQTVVMAVLDELSVNSFDTSETPGEDGVKSQTKFAKDVWDANRMAVTQYDVTEASLRDSESFVLVDYDADTKMPRLTWHERLIDLDNGTFAPGFYMIYPDDNTTQTPIAAIKEWFETITENGRRRTRRRRNMYYPNRVEKFVLEAEWVHYEEVGKPWPTPWVTATGEPIGLPIVRFPNFGGVPEAKEALPAQDAINKLMLDILGEADGAFKMFFLAGDYPTTDGEPEREDGSNRVKVAPMTILSSQNPSATMTPIEGGDPTALMNTLKDIMLLVAQITGTPLSYFIVTKQIAAADTLKGQDKPLTKKVEKRKEIYGQCWEDVMALARRVSNVFGKTQLDESIHFYCQWKQVFDLETIAMMRDTLELPLEFLWRLYGLTEEQIAAIKKMDEYELKQIALETSRLTLKRLKEQKNAPQPSTMDQNQPNDKTAADQTAAGTGSKTTAA